MITFPSHYVKCLDSAGAVNRVKQQKEFRHTNSQTENKLELRQEDRNTPLINFMVAREIYQKNHNKPTNGP